MSYTIFLQQQNAEYVTLQDIVVSVNMRFNKEKKKEISEFLRLYFGLEKTFFSEERLYSLIDYVTSYLILTKFIENVFVVQNPHVIEHD